MGGGRGEMVSLCEKRKIDILLALLSELLLNTAIPTRGDLQVQSQT